MSNTTNKETIMSMSISHGIDMAKSVLTPAAKQRIILSASLSYREGYNAALQLSAHCKEKEDLPAPRDTTEGSYQIMGVKGKDKDEWVQSIDHLPDYLQEVLIVDEKNIVRPIIYTFCFFKYWQPLPSPPNKH